MTPITPQVAEWRVKAAQGTLTREEMREEVTFLRADRLMSVTCSLAAKTAKVEGKKRKGAKDCKALLADFASQMTLPDLQ